MGVLHINPEPSGPVEVTVSVLIRARHGGQNMFSVSHTEAVLRVQLSRTSRLTHDWARARNLRTVNYSIDEPGDHLTSYYGEIGSSRQNFQVCQQVGHLERSMLVFKTHY